MATMTAMEVLMAHAHWSVFVPGCENMLRFRFDSRNQLTPAIDNILREIDMDPQPFKRENELEPPKPEKWVLIDVGLNLIIDREFVEDFVVFGGIYVALSEEACTMSMEELTTCFRVGKMVSDAKAAYQHAGYPLPSTINQFVRLQFPSHAMPFGVPLDFVKDACEPWEPTFRETTVSLAKFEWVIARLLMLQFQPQMYPSRFQPNNAGTVAGCPSEGDWVLIDPSANQKEPIVLNRSSSIDILKSDNPYLILSRSSTVFKPAGDPGEVAKSQSAGAQNLTNTMINHNMSQLLQEVFSTSLDCLKWFYFQIRVGTGELKFPGSLLLFLFEFIRVWGL